VKGSTNLAYGSWLGAMERPEREVRELAARLNKGKRGASGGRLAAERDSVGRMSALFERDLALWMGIFSGEAATVTRFLNLLADLRLNVSPELEELKSLSQRNDYALHRIEGFTRRLRAIAAGERTAGFEDDFPIYRELLSIADSLEKLMARVDEKAEDAIRLVSLMTASVDSQSLMDLLTGEP